MRRDFQVLTSNKGVLTVIRQNIEAGAFGGGAVISTGTGSVPTTCTRPRLTVQAKFALLHWQNADRAAWRCSLRLGATVAAT